MGVVYKRDGFLMIEINRENYKAEKKVLVDGAKEWTVKLPGAKEELMLSQLQRRIQLLEKKVKSDAATEEDLDKLDDLEDKLFKIYYSLIDDNQGNTEVQAWMKDTPFSLIQRFFEDIKEQSEPKNGKQKEELPQDQ